MCDKIILENGGKSILIPDCYKHQDMSNKAIDNSGHALGSVPDCYKTQNVW